MEGLCFKPAKVPVETGQVQFFTLVDLRLLPVRFTSDKASRKTDLVSDKVTDQQSDDQGKDGRTFETLRLGTHPERLVSFCYGSLLLSTSSRDLWAGPIASLPYEPKNRIKSRKLTTPSSFRSA